VRTVREVHSITPVPAVPQFYRGVVNIRGQIITVMDLRIFFGMSVESQDIPRELAVVNTGDLEIGLLAHQVQEVRVVQLTEIAPVEDIRYARGITRDGLIVLDIARLFQEKRLIAGASED
ncbi:MAG: chemotaxis protein CheW, partial [Chloroflexota bacterium]